MYSDALQSPSQFSCFAGINKMPMSRRIAKEEWNQKKDIIIDLYHNRGLPLYSKGGRDSVQSILHAENFSPSRAQLDAFVKSLDQPKNLKKEEWRIVHMKLDKLRKMDIECRVKISGKVVSEERLERSRRHAFGGSRKQHSTTPDIHALPCSNRLEIETRRAGGEWSLYTGQHAVEISDLSSSDNDLAGWNDEQILLGSTDNVAAHRASPKVLSQLRDLAPNQDCIIDLLSSEYVDEHQDHSPRNQQTHLSSPLSPVGFSPQTLMDIDPAFRNTEFDYFNFNPLQPFDDLLGNSSGYSTFGNYYNQQQWNLESPFSPVQGAFYTTPTRDSPPETQFVETYRAGKQQGVAPQGRSLLSPLNMVQSLHQEATMVLMSNSKADAEGCLPEADVIMDNLLSLLPEDIHWNGSLNDSSFDSQFYTAVLYSFVNGFAGLQGVPAGAIFKSLKRLNNINLRFIEFLSLCPPIQAKCLADNMFRAAVEACDEDSVNFILQATQNLPCAIDVNKIACELNGRLYTPVELAAKFRRIGIVDTLLALNADVNKSFAKEGDADQGALALAIRTFDTFEAVDICLVRTILSAHASVQVGLIDYAIRWEKADVILELIAHLSPARHSELFKDRVLENAAECLENNFATNIITRALEYCRSENCVHLADHQEYKENILYTVTKKENRKLVELIISYTSNKDWGLIAAVSNRTRELFDIFLLNGASIGGAPCYVSENGRPSRKRNHQITGIPCTPLAEAIRSQSKSRIDEMERLGALLFLDQSAHFEAAILAAAEVGDCYYIEKLLKHVPKEKNALSAQVLVMALRNKRTEAALMLIDHESDFSGGLPFRGDTTVFEEACRTQNRAILERMFEVGIYVDGGSLLTLIKQPAEFWDNMDMIDGPNLQGARPDDSHEGIVKAAVELERQDLVEVLLESGASPNASDVYDTSPLAKAVESGDGHMVQFLLAHAADPADEQAFLSAIGRIPELFDSLLLAFSQKYPAGKPNFGGALLIEALKRGDVMLLKKMLTMKFDVNSFTITDNYNGYRMTALGYAIIHGKHMTKRIPLLRELISRGNPNSIVCKPRDHKRGDLPLKTALIVAIETRVEDMVKLLLGMGADVHRPARRGLSRTPLQYASEIGSFKMVKLLLEYEADVNEEPAVLGGATALQLAAISGSIKIAKLLISSGADIHAPRAKWHGRTAFEGAAEHSRVEMLRLLWNAAKGRGFSREEIERAKSFALKNEHRGCAEYIDTLHFDFTLDGSFIEL